MRGRKPKPSHLRLLEGNVGKRAINHDEPLPEGDLLEPPEWLNDDQKRGWAYAIAHAPKGLLKRLDRTMLAIWVVAEERHADAARQVTRLGSIVRTRGGDPMQNPYLSVQNKQAQIMLKAAGELGFSPSSRSRIHLGEGEGGKANPFAGFKRG